MRIHSILSATISGVDSELRGTFVHGERTVSVPGTAPGDQVDVQIVSISRHHPLAFGKIRTVHKRGENFVTPLCIRAAPLRGKCGGCTAMHLSADTQNNIRQNHLSEMLGRLGVDASVLQPLQSSQPFGYRNRTNYSVTRSKSGNWVLGSYAPGTREVASMAGCLIVQPEIAAVEPALQQLLKRHAIPVDAQPDALRWISVRANRAAEIVIELIVSNAQANWISSFVDDVMALQLEHGKIIGVALSVNDQKTNAIRVATSQTLAGTTTLHEPFGHVELEIPASAFAQLNTEVASRMYKRAAELAESPNIIWDLYGGLGGLGLNLAATHHGTQVFGADASDASCDAATRTARKLNLNATYIAADLSTTSSDEWSQNWPAPDTIIVNPPRRGLDPGVLTFLETTATARTLLYMSCGPQSFERDAHQLLAAGWRLDLLEAHDMLPQTGHVELLARFTRTAP